jgi:hypothetical protein
MLWGFDLLILAGCLAVGGSFITARSLMKESSSKLAESFWGSNPYQRRNQIIVRHETVAGTVWQLLSLLVLCAGTIVSFIFPPALHVPTAMLHAGGIILVTCLLVFCTVTLTQRKSKMIYVPMMIDLRRAEFDRCRALISHPGEEQRKQAGRDLDQIGELIDIPRLLNEPDLEYFKRLEPNFIC